MADMREIAGEHHILGHRIADKRDAGRPARSAADVTRRRHRRLPDVEMRVVAGRGFGAGHVFADAQEIAPAAVSFPIRRDGIEVPAPVRGPLKRPFGLFQNVVTAVAGAHLHPDRRTFHRAVVLTLEPVVEEPHVLGDRRFGVAVREPRVDEVELLGLRSRRPDEGLAAAQLVDHDTGLRADDPHRKAHAAWGRRAYRLEPDPETAHIVRWIFARRLAGHSVARIARALNDAGVPCPSAADPGRNPHRAGAGWTLGTVTTILQNPRYTGHQVWNRQRTDRDLVDTGDIALGHKPVQRWNLPDGWVISRKPAHPALVSEADFIAAQDISAARGPAPAIGLTAPRKRRYLLAGLLICGGCGRRMESAWSNGKAAYRCRHGHTTASVRGPGRLKNAYIREDRILPHLPALHLHLTEPAAGQRRRRTRRGADVRYQASPENMIGYLRERQITLTYDPASGALHAGTAEAAQTITLTAS